MWNLFSGPNIYMRFWILSINIFHKYSVHIQYSPTVAFLVFGIGRFLHYIVCFFFYLAYLSHTERDHTFEPRPACKKYSCLQPNLHYLFVFVKQAALFSCNKMGVPWGNLSQKMFLRNHQNPLDFALFTFRHVSFSNISLFLASFPNHMCSYMKFKCIRLI